jgi:hypothetical protein
MRINELGRPAIEARWCPECKRRSANQPYCLRGCFSVSRFAGAQGPINLCSNRRGGALETCRWPEKP